jgi:hypothetical protein
MGGKQCKAALLWSAQLRSTQLGSAPLQWKRTLPRGRYTAYVMSDRTRKTARRSGGARGARGCVVLCIQHILSIIIDPQSVGKRRHDLMDR